MGTDEGSRTEQGDPGITGISDDAENPGCTECITTNMFSDSITSESSAVPDDAANGRNDDAEYDTGGTEPWHGYFSGIEKFGGDGQDDAGDGGQNDECAIEGTDAEDREMFWIVHSGGIERVMVK